MTLTNLTISADVYEDMMFEILKLRDTITELEIELFELREEKELTSKENG